MNQLLIGLILLGMLCILIGIPTYCICCYRKSNNYDYDVV